MRSSHLGHGGSGYLVGVHGCELGGVGAADRGDAAALQDAAEGVAADDVGHRVAAPERGQVAQHPSRAWPLVAGGAVVHSLGQARRVGAFAVVLPSSLVRALRDLLGLLSLVGKGPRGQAPQR